MPDGLGRISGSILAENLLRQGIDLAFETSLLYIDVNNGRIGITTDTPIRELYVPEYIKSTNLIVDNQSNFPNYRIFDNNIQNLVDIIYIRPDQINPQIAGPRFGVDNLRFSDQLIENFVLDSDIQLLPSGTGIVHFTTDTLNISGNLHATGDITADGSIIFGNDPSDNIVFESDIKSNIIPNVDNAYDLGSVSQEWGKLYSYTLKSNTITADFVSTDLDFLVTPGKTIYVSINGNDTNYGDHQHSTYRTIKHALSQATSGDEVVVFPGVYQEIFPLTIPQGVTLRGSGIRSVTIEPTVETNTNDAILLNGDTTVEFLTIRNFYQGYAFKLASNFKSLIRSPYIYNVTVITKGSIVSESDPFGYYEEDAGGGAYIDGSVADPTSTILPTCLFFSVTFIVPNANGLVLTNGVRVEWLNSFTYYAKRGLYLLNGTLGRFNQGSIFGAELRSINSANVYGEFGAIADGADTLGYLIGHNFGYIGTLDNNKNDPKLSVQANEITTFNDGILYFDSQDHKGDVRIGDIFYVNQETGNVTFDSKSVNFGSDGSISLNGPTSSTYIDKYGIETGNLRIYDNNIDSLTGPVNFHAASGSTYLNTDVFVTGNTTITADVFVGNNVYFGDTPFDNITILPKLTQDIKPKDTDQWNLGSDTKRWNTLYGTLLDVDGVTQITNNIISTLTTDTDLQLIANGTGKIRISSTDVQVNQNFIIDDIFTVNGLSTLQSVDITGNINITGNIDQTGNTFIEGTFANNNIIINGDSYFDVFSIRLYDNFILAQTIDDDLEFYGNGTGGVALDSKIKITDNNISNFWSGATTDTQKSVILSPNGTGQLFINSTKSLVLPIGNNTNRVFSQVGEVRYNNLSNMVEGWSPSGYVNFMNLWDSDRNTYITAELTPGTNDNTLRFGINGTVKATITPTALWSNSTHIDNINILSNNISNLVSANDIELLPSGTGILNVNNVDIIGDTITNNLDTALIFEGTSAGYLKFSGTFGVVFPFGNNSERRLTPELGEMRYNTEIEYLEIFNGTVWQPAQGYSPVATPEEVEEIMGLWSVILG